MLVPYRCSHFAVARRSPDLALVAPAAVLPATIHVDDAHDAA
jgi:hypothetical protein